MFNWDFRYPGQNDLQSLHANQHCIVTTNIQISSDSQHKRTEFPTLFAKHTKP